MVRGDVYLADLGCLDPSTNTHTQIGKRPVIIYQDEKVNRFGKTIIVIPCSSNPNKSKTSTHFELHADLRKTTYALCEHMKVIDKSKLFYKMGSIPKNELKEIDTIVSRILKIGERQLWLRVVK